MSEPISEMVERVGRALAAQWEEPEWDLMHPEKRERFRADARAAIETMREPTVEMMAALSPPLSPEAARDRWRVAIDAALEP